MPHITPPDNTRLYFKDWGAGRPVILIHGARGSAIVPSGASLPG